MAVPKWIVSRYQLLGPLGSGGTSTIYRAIDRKDPDQRLVAVKLLGQLPTHDRDLLKEMFAREVNALARLSHPNIVQLYDFGHDTDADLLYLVLEYVENATTLRDLIPKWNPDTAACIEILIELLDAVGYAHSIYVIHRDLNPSNILFDQDGRNKIIDFGVSKILGDLTAQQTVGEMYTRAYASPEQRSHSTIGPQSDLYSLAALFYFLVTYQDPTPDAPLVKQLDALAKSSPKALPKDLLEVLRRLATVEPTERYHTAAQAKLALERVQRELRVESDRIYVKLTRNAVTKLVEQLVLERADENAARDHIANALGGEVHVTIPAGEKTVSDEPMYDLIVDNLSLRCKLGPDKPGPKTYFVVIGLTASILPHDLERKRHVAYSLRANWRVGAPSEPVPTSLESLSSVLDHVDAFFEGRALEIKKRERRLDLVDNWRNLLSLDHELQAERTIKVDYLAWEPSSKHTVLKLRLARPDLPQDAESFAIGEVLQMTAKNRRSLRVGHFLSRDASSIFISRLPDLSLDRLASSGTLTIDDSQWAAAWGRQRTALDMLVDGRSQNPRLPEILLTPANATYLIEEQVDHYFNKNLDEAKQNAVNAALAARDLYLIQGPPGTGKTVLIAELIAQILSRHPDVKILLVSQSNVAVDHVLLALTDLLTSASIDRNLVRVGREAAVSSEMKSLLITSRLDSWIDEIKQACNAYVATRFPTPSHPEHVTEVIETVNTLLRSPSRDADEIVGWVTLLRHHFSDTMIEPTQSSMDALLHGAPLSPRETSVKSALEEWMLRIASVDDLQDTYLNACSVIAGTCVGIAGVQNLPTSFDWVIVDEAGRATPSEVMIPLVRGRHAILVGDHKQLPPVIDHDLYHRAVQHEEIDSTWLTQSLFEYLFRRLPENLKTVLRTQYRMHPHIASLVSTSFYREENLTTGVDESARAHQWATWSTAVVWYSTSGLDNRWETSDANSKFNMCEVALIARQLDDLEQNLRSIHVHKTVAAIAGYSAQIALLKRTLDPDDKTRWQSIDLEINTVDAFQGRERDIVFYSVVRSNKNREIGFLGDERRLNVALSRAREMLFIVGDHRMVGEARVPLGMSNPFSEVLKHILTHPTECTLTEVEP